MNTINRFDKQVLDLVNRGYRMAQIVTHLASTKTGVLKSMKRGRQKLSNLHHCATRSCAVSSCQKDGVLLTSGNWYCRGCCTKWRSINHNNVAFYTERGRTTQGTENREHWIKTAQTMVAPFYSTAPEGWDIILYQEKQAFLRFDGLIVHQLGDGWYINTAHPLFEVIHGYQDRLEAMAQVDEHIPMGEPL